MYSRYDVNADVGRMVYVKPIAVATLPKEVQDQAAGLERLYAVHDAQGQQLALVSDRNLAIDLARKNDFAPQPLH